MDSTPHPRRIAVTALAAISLAAAVCASPSAALAAEDQVTFGVQPATAEGPDRRPLLDYGLTPGARATDHVAVLNYSDQALPLTVYATDAVPSEDGSYALLPGAQPPTDIGAWIDLGAPQVEVVVPPRDAERPGQVVLPIRIEVPLDATPGDHVGGVTAVLTTVDAVADGPSVRLDQRVATRVYARVAGELRPSLVVADLRADYRGSANPAGTGTVRVTYTLRNEGNVALGAEQRVAVQGLAGPTRTVRPEPAPLLTPGSSASFTVEVQDVWPSFWVTARVTATPVGRDGALVAGVEPAVGEASTWAIPWALLALILAVLLAAAWFERRRRRPRPLAAHHLVTPRQETPAQ